MCDREPADVPKVPSTADFPHNADQLKHAVERVLRARALSDKVDHEIASALVRKRSGFDTCRISFRKIGVHFSEKCSDVDRHAGAITNPMMTSGGRSS